MNKHIKGIKEAVLQHSKGIDEREATLSGLKAKIKEGSIAQLDYDEQVSNLSSHEQSKQGTIGTVNKIIKAYESELDEWAKLEANELTDDLKLFNSPINLEESDYQSLETKYQTNYSMLKAIKDHARKNDVSYRSQYSVDPNEKLEKFNEFVGLAKRLIETNRVGSPKPYNVMLWNKEESFNNIHADTAQLIQTNEGNRKLVGSDGTVTWA